jgi:hypothetical protein
VALRRGGLPELVPEEGLVDPDDAGAFAERVSVRFADVEAGERALATARSKLAPAAIAPQLEQVYSGQ